MAGARSSHLGRLGLIVVAVGHALAALLPGSAAGAAPPQTATVITEGPPPCLNFMHELVVQGDEARPEDGEVRL